MNKIDPILNFIILFGFGYSIPEVFDGHFIWLLIFVPGLIYFVLRIKLLLKK